MTDIVVSTAYGDLPAAFGTPDGKGPFPGMVVIHDALGMTPDLQRQVAWLVGEGFIAIAPDLYSWGGKVRCVVSVIRDAIRRKGRAFDEIEACRAYLAGHPDCNGKVGVIGFCMGGGFAMMLITPNHGFQASSVNYGSLPSDLEDFAATACPVVGSFGAKDKSLKGAADRLETILTKAGVPHDVKEYAEAGHAFLNDHSGEKLPALVKAMSWMTGGADYHEPSALHARQRIAKFLREHLG